MIIPTNVINEISHANDYDFCANLLNLIDARILRVLDTYKEMIERDTIEAPNVLDYLDKLSELRIRVKDLT
jgi:hypothetical protein